MIAGPRHQALWPPPRVHSRRESDRHLGQRYDQDLETESLLMARKKKTSPGQLGLLEACVTTAPCVPAVRDAVEKWRNANFPDITDTTRALLNYWFRSDHRLPDGRRFAYHVCKTRTASRLPKDYFWHTQTVPAYSGKFRRCRRRVRAAFGFGKCRAYSLRAGIS